MKSEDLQDFLLNLPAGEACLILREGRPEDLVKIRSCIQGRGLPILRERRFDQPDGLVTLAVSLPPRSLHDLLLELVAKGVGGELIGYEAGDERKHGFGGDHK